MKSLFVATFLICISAGYGLKCYTCVSTKSWDDCGDVKKEMTCPPTFDRCFKAYAKVKAEGASVESYGKGCLTDAACDAYDKFDFCKGKGECKVDCCSGDLCNGAALEKVSAIALIASVVMALLY